MLTKAGVQEVLRTLHTAQVDASLRDQALIVADQIQNGSLIYVGEVLRSTGFVLLAVLVFLFQIGGPEAVGMVVYFVPAAAQYVLDSVVSVSLVIVAFLVTVGFLLRLWYVSYSERKLLPELTGHGSIIPSSKTSFSSWQLGMRVSKTAAGKFEIRRVVSDGPAARNGVRPSMTLAQVDGRSTEGWSLAQLSTALYGVRGSMVALRLLKPSADGSASTADENSDVAAERADAERGFHALCLARPRPADSGIAIDAPDGCTCVEAYRLSVHGDSETQIVQEAIKALQYEVDVESEQVRVPWIPVFWPGGERAIMQREPRFPRKAGAFGTQFGRRTEAQKSKPRHVSSDSEGGSYTIRYDSAGCLSPTSMAHESRYYKKQIRKRLAELGMRIEYMSTDFDSCDSATSKHTFHKCARDDGDYTPRSKRRLTNLRARRKAKRKARLQAREEARALARKFGTWPAAGPGEADRTFSSDSEFEEPRPAPPPRKVGARRPRGHPTHVTRTDDGADADNECENGPADDGPTDRSSTDDVGTRVASCNTALSYRATIGPETTVEQLRASLMSPYGPIKERCAFFADCDASSPQLEDSVVISHLVLSQSGLERNGLSSVAPDRYGVESDAARSGDSHSVDSSRSEIQQNPEDLFVLRSVHGPSIEASNDANVDASITGGPTTEGCEETVANTAGESCVSSASVSASAADLLHSSLSKTSPASADSAAENPSKVGSSSTPGSEELEAAPPAEGMVSCIDVTLRRGYYQGKDYHLGVSADSAMSTTKRASAGEASDEPGTDLERFCRICQCAENEAPEMGRCVSL
jgi:hypothetical protein